MISKDKISGVYKITNKITGDFYIGSSKNIKRRWYSHKCPYRLKELKDIGKNGIKLIEMKN